MKYCVYVSDTKVDLFCPAPLGNLRMVCGVCLLAPQFGIALLAKGIVMENIVKILFLVMVFLVPLGMLAALGFVMQARKAATAGDGARSILLRRQALERLWFALASGFLGLIGYLLISRNLIPALEPELILIILFVALFFVYFFIRRKLKLPKWKDWF